MSGRWRYLAALLLVSAGCGATTSTPDANETAAAPATASCPPEGTSPAGAPGDYDVVIGPLALVGARSFPRQQRQAGRLPAFGGNGYKVPATLSAGVVATLSVPPRLRGKVGLVYTQRAQRAAWEEGVRGADRRVRFAACADSDPAARSGWPGGIVVDRPRCATLVVHVLGDPEPLRRRVPLGRRCQR